MKFLKPDTTFRQCVDELILLSRLYPIRSPQVKSVYESVQHPFAKECLGLLLDSVLDEKSLNRVLRTRMETHHKAKFGRVDQLKFVSQAILFFAFPIAFVFILNESYASAGWTLLFATFVTSAVIAPIGLFWKKKALRERAMNEAIVHGVHLISMKTNPIVVSEELNSFLAKDERIPWVAVALTTGKKAA